MVELCEDLWLWIGSADDEEGEEGGLDFWIGGFG